MRWTVKSRDGVRAGLTLAQLEGLVAAGTLRADDLLRPEGTRPGEEPAWRRVDETSYLRRALPPAAGVPGGFPFHGPLSEDAVALFLSAESDAPKMRRIQRIATVVKVAAGAILALEAWLLVRAITTGL